MEFCTFASGSSGNCAVIFTDNTAVLIDAGISMRRINSCLKTLGLSLSSISAILVTHEHSDHVKGLPMILKYHDLPVYAPKGACGRLPLGNSNACRSIIEFSPGESFSIGDFLVSSFSTPHDCSSSSGYKFTCGGKSLVFATDMGYVADTVYETAVGSDFAVLESNHDVDVLQSGVYPYYLKRRILSSRWHLSNLQCSRLVAALAKSGTKHFLLAHLSQENNTPALALDASRTALEKEGFIIGENVFLDIASRDEMTHRFII